MQVSNAIYHTVALCSCVEHAAGVNKVVSGEISWIAVRGILPFDVTLLLLSGDLEVCSMAAVRGRCFERAFRSGFDIGCTGVLICSSNICVNGDELPRHCTCSAYERIMKSGITIKVIVEAMKVTLAVCPTSRDMAPALSSAESGSNVCLLLERFHVSSRQCHMLAEGVLAISSQPLVNFEALPVLLLQPRWKPSPTECEKGCHQPVRRICSVAHGRKLPKIAAYLKISF